MTKMMARLFYTEGEAVLDARTSAISFCACALALIAGCEKSKHDDMSWAQHALERNSAVQILSVDRQARSFTVRLKDTGELRIVQADEIVGSMPTPEAPATAAPAANAAPEKAANPAPASDSAAGSTPQSPGATEPQGAAATAAPVTGAGVIASGPGYSIRAARNDTSANARASGFAPADTFARGVAIERRDEPIICQGARFLRIDGRNLEFEGDAISAEDGCEIHITNSRIAAKGVGVSARAANVHIDNSSIEGQSGSILASDGAQVYAQSSRFRGLSRGLTPETLHDLGGNVWN